MTTKKKPDDAEALARYYKQVRDNPLGGLLVEDLAASREHGQVTARVGIAPDGNPILYARDEATAKAIGAAVQKQTAVHAQVIPVLSVSQFRVLERQSVTRLSRDVEVTTTRSVVRPCGNVHDGPCSMENDTDSPMAAAEPAGPTDDAPFTVRIRSSERGPVVEQLGPFAIITQAVDAMRGRGSAGQVATIYDGSTVAQYRGDRARFRFGRSQWSRDT